LRSSRFALFLQFVPNIDWLQSITFSVKVWQSNISYWAVIPGSVKRVLIQWINDVIYRLTCWKLMWSVLWNIAYFLTFLRGLYIGIWNWGGYRQMFLGGGGVNMREAKFYIKIYYSKKIYTLSRGRGGVVTQLGGLYRPPGEV